MALLRSVISDENDSLLRGNLQLPGGVEMHGRGLACQWASQASIQKAPHKQGVDSLTNKLLKMGSDKTHHGLKNLAKWRKRNWREPE